MGTETPLTAGLCDRPDVLVHVLRNLTRRDAAALAASAAALRGAVRLCESSGGALQYQPRLFVACSGTSKLVEIPLDTSGPVAPPVTAQCLRRPPRKGSGALAGAQRRSAPSWPTSLAFSPWTRQLHVCQYSVHGVMTLAAPPAPPRQRGGRGGRGPAAVRPQQPARRVLIGRRAIEGPEGLAFADNGFLYVATINGSLAQIDPQKGTLLSTSPLPRAHFGDVPWPWPLVPWGMAAWPAPAAAPRAGAGAGEEQEAPASLLPAAGPGQEAPPAQLLVACELDYGTDSYTDSPPADSTDGAFCTQHCPQMLLSALPPQACDVFPPPSSSQPHLIAAASHPSLRCQAASCALSWRLMAACRAGNASRRRPSSSQGLVASASALAARRCLSQRWAARERLSS